MFPRTSRVGAALLWLQLVAAPLRAYSGAVAPTTKADVAQVLDASKLAQVKASVVPPSTGGHEPTTLHVGVDASGVAELTKASSARLMRRAGLSPGTASSDDQDTKKASLPVDASAHFVGASFFNAPNPSPRSDPSGTMPLAAFFESGAKEANSPTKKGGKPRGRRQRHTRTKKRKGNADSESPSDEGTDASTDDSALSQNDMQQSGDADTSDDPGTGDGSGGDASSDDSAASQNNVQQEGDADTSADPGAGDGSGGDASSDDSAASQNNVQQEGDADTSADPGAGDGSGGDVSSDETSLSQEDTEDTQQTNDAGTNEHPGAGDGSGGDVSSDDTSLSQEDTEETQQKGDAGTSDDPGAGDASGEDATSDDSSLSQEDADTSGDPGAGDGSGGDAPSDDSSLATVKGEDIRAIPNGSETSGEDSASDDSSLSQEDAQDAGGDSASDASPVSQEETQEKDPGDTDSSGAEASSDDSSLLEQNVKDNDGSQAGAYPLGGDSSGARIERFPDEPTTHTRGDFPDGAHTEHYPSKHTARADGAQRQYYPEDEATGQKRAFSDGATMRTDGQHPDAFSDLRHASRTSSGASEVDIAKTEAADARRAMEYQVEKIVDRTIADTLHRANKARE